MRKVCAFILGAALLMGLLPVQQPGHVYAAELISIFDAEVTVAEGEYRYIASEIKPQVTVTLKGSTLKEGTDYDVFFSDNVIPGLASVTVEGKGNYEGNARGTFLIQKAPLTIRVKNQE